MNPTFSLSGWLPASRDLPQDLRESEALILLEDFFCELLPLALNTEDISPAELIENLLRTLLRLTGCQGIGLYRQHSAQQWERLVGIGGRSLATPEQSWLPQITAAELSQAETLPQMANYPAEGWGQMAIPFRSRLFASEAVSGVASEAVSGQTWLVLSARKPEAIPLTLLLAVRPVWEQFCDVLEQVVTFQRQQQQHRQQLADWRQILECPSIQEMLSFLSRSMAEHATAHSSEGALLAVLAPKAHGSPCWITGAATAEAWLLSPADQAAMQLSDNSVALQFSDSELSPELMSQIPLLTAAAVAVDGQEPPPRPWSRFRFSTAADAWAGWLLVQELQPEASQKQIRDWLTALLPALRLRFQQEYWRSLAGLMRRAAEFSGESDKQEIFPGEDRKKLQEQLREVAAVSLPVFLEGAAGSGKSWAAAFLHQHQYQHQLSQSREGHKPPVPSRLLTLAAYQLTPERLQETWQETLTPNFPARCFDEALFQIVDKPTTVVLEEIGELPLTAQKELLRWLTDSQSQPVPVTPLRLIVTSRESWETLVKKQKLLPELAQELGQIIIRLPALRESPGEVLARMDYFARQQGFEQFSVASILDAAASEQLSRYDWPGNLAELREFTRRLLQKASASPISRYDLELLLQPPSSDIAGEASPLGLAEATVQFQQQYIRQTIARCQGNMTEAARALGLHRSNLYRKMHQLEMAEAEQSEEQRD